MPLNVRLYGYDADSGKNLELLAEYLTQKGHNVKGFYFEHPMSDVEMVDWLKGADVVVTGMSSKNSQFELRLTEIAQFMINIPVLWFSDAYLAFNQSAFVDSGLLPNSLAVVSEKEVDLAYQNAYDNVVAVGCLPDNKQALEKLVEEIKFIVCIRR